MTLPPDLDPPTLLVLLTRLVERVIALDAAAPWHPMSRPDPISAFLTNLNPRFHGVSRKRVFARRSPPPARCARPGNASGACGDTSERCTRADVTRSVRSSTSRRGLQWHPRDRIGLANISPSSWRKIQFERPLLGKLATERDGPGHNLARSKTHERHRRHTRDPHGYSRTRLRRHAQRRESWTAPKTRPFARSIDRRARKNPRPFLHELTPPSFPRPFPRPFPPGKERPPYPHRSSPREAPRHHGDQG